LNRHRPLSVARRSAHARSAAQVKKKPKREKRHAENEHQRRQFAAGAVAGFAAATLGKAAAAGRAVLRQQGA